MFTSISEIHDAFTIHAYLHSQLNELQQVKDVRCGGMDDGS